MSILHVNNFSTTLNGSITNSATSIVVTSATGGPAVGSGANAYFTITDGTNTEIVLATAVSTNTYTVTRAQQGTTANAFASGSTFYQCDTAYDYDRINTPNDATIHSITVGLGTSSVATNTAVGVSAANAITSGSHETMVGYQAGIAITSGADNTCIGYLAGQKITTQAGNTCVGSTSGNQTVSTQQTTCVGYKAGQAAASQDTAVGYQALAAGSGDAFGYNVLNASTGTQNVGVGNAALSGASYTGSQSVVVGASSLSSATSGGTNTAVGYNCGQTGATGSAALTTGSGNTLLGYQASVNNLGATGTIAIGKNAVADINTGTTSGTAGPGIAIGSASAKVGFRGDGTIYPSGSNAGFFRVKINGTYYLVPLVTDGATDLTIDAAAIETDSTPTPVLNFGGATTGITYTIQTCKKSIIGNMCFLSIQIQLSSKGTATGAATITGVATAPRGSMIVTSQLILESSTLPTQPVIYCNSTTINLATMNNGTFLSALTDTSFTNSSAIYINMAYPI